MSCQYKYISVSVCVCDICAVHMHVLAVTVRMSRWEKDLEIRRSVVGFLSLYISFFLFLFQYSNNLKQ